MAKNRALALTRLTLTDFRNYARLRLDVDAGPVVLTGPNGAGKTNLLEALSVLCPGRGLRSATYADMARHDGSGGWAIAAELNGPRAELRVGTAWEGRRAEPDDEDALEISTAQGRQVRIEGTSHRGSGALASVIRMVWITPAMDRLFNGPAGDRRRFLDRLVLGIDPDHGSRVQAFEKLMRERNRLLEDMREGQRRDGIWLDGIEAAMAEHAVAIAAARRAAVDALQLASAQQHGEAHMGGFPWGIFLIEGELEAAIADLPAVEVEERYRRTLADTRLLDAGAGRCLRGPHRSDLVVKHGPKSMEARLCSTGEQKALLIGIILANARMIAEGFEGYAPIMLLDEVAAHLDEERRRGLFECLLRLGAQAWMTGTDETLFAALRGAAQFFSARDGALCEAVA
ncbi:DNA replication/repair protein RecF [Rhodoligotrophos defluvii]|uniref:DNA replication/repair protein RecF n=1 Tax=Rhodoligotrophos defluvii TaxID=2561934 RepID=UPI001EEFAEFE|nr:DNA replication/repair protein RecF [Rhodoligotrophos defluvii]